MNSKTLIGHPVGLFVLFFTEMWERFSYYGMRAILVLFLTSEIAEKGWAWTRADALILYGWYTGLVYLTPIIGGWIADNKLGARNAIVLGALLMTFGHASLAFELVPAFYLGLGLLIIGNGLFKPNISAIVGQLYPDGSPLKDSGYTIFYMGVNSGAFLGMVLCGYLGEQVSWSYGFGAAGIFMLFGLLQFWFGQKIFGKIGLKPEARTKAITQSDEAAVPFTQADKNGFAASIITTILTVLAILNMEWIESWMQTGTDPAILKLLLAIPFLLVWSYFILKRLQKYPTVERDRLTVLAVFSFFVIFFWTAYEQQGGSMTIFANDYTDRSLTTPFALTTYRIVSAALTLVPIAILTLVLVQLSLKIVRDYPLTILFTGISFLIIWGIIIWINVRNYGASGVEVPASWFASLSAFFIISLAPLFSAMWVFLTKKNLNPSGPVKFGLGLFFLGIGFAIMMIGSASIPQGARTASVSMIWLALAYFFHVLGELSISPVGLSYVNKLSPVRLVGLMFGIWFIANFIAGFAGGIVGSYMDDIIARWSLARFFSIFVITSFVAGGVMLLLNGRLKKMMHGIT